MSINNDLVTSAYEELGLTKSNNTDKKQGELGQEDFLALMTTQLKNQDPFAPMESGDFLGDMAQFGTVNGIEDLNNTFKELASSLYSNQALQASSMVGKSALVSGNSGHFDGTNPFEGGVNLPSSVTDLKVTITGVGGHIIKQMDMGIQPNGVTNFSWDGTDNNGNVMPEGSYNIVAEATINGENTALETLVEGVVESVTLGSGGAGLTFNIKGIGEATFEDIKQVRN
ncbi:MAG: flagellar hook assembly protein FlgD [Gammaproteobacteria bacterium]|nr:flagellar hook assembly protein FlgD [Gammaproteobacteria bacterium]